MNTPPASPDGTGPAPSDAFHAHRETLRRALAYRGLEVEAVERVLGDFVADLRDQGKSPEAVVVAVKQLLADRQPPDADADVDSVKAFQAAHESRDLYGAIVTLAIAQYYGIHLRTSDIIRDPGPAPRRRD